jgi:hypothetical protein
MIERAVAYFMGSRVFFITAPTSHISFRNPILLPVGQDALVNVMFWLTDG